MLIASMMSDDSGNLAGIVEGGERVPLSVPHCRAVSGRSSYKGSVDAALEEEMRRLKERARIDTGNYYSIGEPVHFENESIFSIPYVMFFK